VDVSSSTAVPMRTGGVANPFPVYDGGSGRVETNPFDQLMFL